MRTQTLIWTKEDNPDLAQNVSLGLISFPNYVSCDANWTWSEMKTGSDTCDLSEEPVSHSLIFITSLIDVFWTAPPDKIFSS